MKIFWTKELLFLVSATGLAYVWSIGHEQLVIFFISWLIITIGARQAEHYDY